MDLKPSDLPTESGWYQTKHWDYALLLDPHGRWWWDGREIDATKVVNVFAPLMRLVPEAQFADA